MAEIASFLGAKVGSIKLGDQEYNVYRLTLNDLAELELMYGTDELFSGGGNKRLNLLLDALTLSIRREDKTITREFVGSHIDPFDPEQINLINELYMKMIGVETSGPAKGKK